MDQLYAFESWSNGNQYEVSPFYEMEQANKFIAAHYNSQSFARLHVFNDKMAAEKMYAALQKEADDENIHYRDEREYDESMN